MTMKAVQVPVHFTVSDPNNVPETLVSGPVTVQIGPELSQIVLTSARPDFGLLVKGQIDQNPKAVVTVKAVFPTSAIRALSANLIQGLNALDAVRAGAAPNGGIVMPGGQSNH